MRNKFTSNAFFKGKSHKDAYFMSKENKSRKKSGYHNAMYAKDEDYNANGIIWRKLHPEKYVYYPARVWFQTAVSYSHYSTIFYPEQVIMDHGGASGRVSRVGTKLIVDCGGPYLPLKHLTYSYDAKLWKKYEVDDYVHDVRPVANGLIYLTSDKTDTYGDWSTKKEWHYLEIDFENDEVLNDTTILTENFQNEDDRYSAYSIVDTNGGEYGQYHDTGIIVRRHLNKNVTNYTYYVLGIDGSLNKIPIDRYHYIDGVFYGNGSYFIITHRDTGLDTSTGYAIYGSFVFTSTNGITWQRKSMGSPFVWNIYGSKGGYMNAVWDGSKFLLYMNFYTTSSNTFEKRIYSTTNFVSFSLVKILPDYIKIKEHNSDNYAWILLSSKTIPNIPEKDTQLSLRYDTSIFTRTCEFKDYNRIFPRNCIGICVDKPGTDWTYHVYLDNLMFENSPNNFVLNATKYISDSGYYGNFCKFGDINAWEHDNSNEEEIADEV